MKLLNSKSAKRAAGFTLLEVVLAMGIFLLGATAILGFLTFGAALSRTASLRTLSAEAVEAVVADLEEGLFSIEPDGSVGEAQAIQNREVPGYPQLTYSVQTMEDVADEDHLERSAEVRVDVEIHWKGGVSKRGRRLSILLLKEVPFGVRMRHALANPDGATDDEDEQRTLSGVQIESGYE
ncbi:MAG: hypothetical protein ACI8TQ_003660 [Planctomycetota bacterium]|jgi:hypothetical protein